MISRLKAYHCFERQNRHVCGLTWILFSSKIVQHLFFTLSYNGLMRMQQTLRCWYSLPSLWRQGQSALTCVWTVYRLASLPHEMTRFYRGQRRLCGRIFVGNGESSSYGVDNISQCQVSQCHSCHVESFKTNHATTAPHQTASHTLRISRNCERLCSFGIPSISSGCFGTCAVVFVSRVCRNHVVSESAYDVICSCDSTWRVG